MATKYGAAGPSNFQSSANFTSVCADALPSVAISRTGSADHLTAEGLTIVCCSQSRPAKPGRLMRFEQSVCQRLPWRIADDQGDQRTVLPPAWAGPADLPKSASRYQLPR